MGAKTVFRALVLIASSVCSSIALAFTFNNDVIHRICVPEAVRDKPMPVPVGCKLVDCCPGCPGPGPIEWRIKVDAKVLQGAELRFEGMDAAELRKLKTTGNARIDGNRILLRRGSSTIRGIPDKIGGKVAVGLLLPIVSREAAARRLPVTAGRPATRVRDDITVRQFLAPFPVNDFRWRHIIRACASPKAGAQLDRLKVPNVIPGETVVVMLDARTGAGCSNDQAFPSTGNSVFGNLRSSGTCNSEIAVFSASNKLLLEWPVTTWTNPPGDLHTTLPLEPLIKVPVSVWIAGGVVAARAVDEMNNANLLYRQNRVGVEFVASYNSLSSEMDTLIGTDRCDAVAGIKKSAFYTPNTLNVYYANGAFYGRNCAIKHTPPPGACSGTGDKGDGNITLIGGLINLVAVAHELGHAFGLRPGPFPCGGHTDKLTATGEWVNLPGFDDDNIMRSDAPDLANYFTLGQVFRMNTQKDEWDGTMLIQNGLRPGADRRECTPPNGGETSRCPALATDWP